jgi:uncharacterized coiled-coil protein SlyX
MSDFNYATEDVKNTYEQQTDKQIQELNKIIIAFRTKAALLEKQIESLKNQLKEREKIPVPQTVIKQIADLELKNRKLAEEIEYYKKFVPVQVIINRENNKKPTRRGGLR